MTPSIKAAMDWFKHDRTWCPCMPHGGAIIAELRRLQARNERLRERNENLEKVAEAALAVVSDWPGWDYDPSQVKVCVDLENSLVALPCIEAGKEKS